MLDKWMLLCSHRSFRELLVHLMNTLEGLALSPVLKSTITVVCRLSPCCDSFIKLLVRQGAHVLLRKLN